MAAEDDIPVEELKKLECDDDDVTTGYKAPAPKDLKTIQDLDADDESLNTYKATLLGKTSDIFDEGGLNVLLKKLIIRVEGREDIVLDISGTEKEVNKGKDKTVFLKEGCLYKLCVVFRVQREIVCGLKFKNEIYRKGIKVEKETYMVGSYGPRKDEYEYVRKEEEAPSGMLSRGSYKAKTAFLDDDKNSIKDWEWNFEIKKDWSTSKSKE